MNPFTKPTAMALLGVLFTAGAVVGGVAGFNYGKSSTIRSFIRPPDPKQMRESFRDHLKNEVALTEDQLTQIDPIFEDVAKQMQRIHGESMQKIGLITSNSDEQIKKFLTADQRKLWDAMKARDRERRERERPHGPGLHGPPSGPWRPPGTNSTAEKPRAATCNSFSVACRSQTGAESDR